MTARVVATRDERLRCPACGVGTVELVLGGAVGESYVPGGVATLGRPLPWRWTLVPFGACNVCEFCIRIDRSERARAP